MALAWEYSHRKEKIVAAQILFGSLGGKSSLSCWSDPKLFSEMLSSIAID